MLDVLDCPEYIFNEETVSTLALQVLYNKGLLNEEGKDKFIQRLICEKEEYERTNNTELTLD